jgi:peptidoglycan/xylan/chitin deacetylase (PgdA/CDA1 family)
MAAAVKKEARWMLPVKNRLGITLIVLAGCAAAQVKPGVPVAGVVRDTVQDYRKILVLLDGAGASDSDAELVASYLYTRNTERLEELLEHLRTDGEARRTFLQQLDNDPELRDADRLVFRDVVEELPPGPAEDAMRAKLAQLEQRYDEELRKLMDKLSGGKGLLDGPPEPWPDYLAFLRSRYSRPQILLENQAIVAATREGAKGLPWRDDPDQITGSRLPAKTVALTFDDGPSSRYTEQVLRILAAHQIKAVFFEVGHRAEHLGRYSQRILREGHTLGNHSYSHPVLPTLAAAKIETELKSTTDIIEKNTHRRVVLFRPPYGSRSLEVRDAARRQKMKVVLWNVDSLDWRDSLPTKIAANVMTQLNKSGRGIILFHDIHLRTVNALPAIIEAVKNAGYTFLVWSDAEGAFVRGPAAPPGRVTQSEGSERRAPGQAEARERVPSRARREGEPHRHAARGRRG